MALKVRQKVWLIYDSRVLESQISSIETVQSAGVNSRLKPTVCTNVTYRVGVGKAGWPAFKAEQLFTSKEALLASL